MNKEPRLRFTEEERANPALEKPIRKADKAAAKADKAQAKIPKKQIRQNTVDPETGKAVSYTHLSLKTHGFDFLKVDNQAFTLPLYMGSRCV